MSARQRKPHKDTNETEGMKKPQRRPSWQNPPAAVMWLYKDLSGIDWDAQPACFITNYVLAIQCFCFSILTILFKYSSTSSYWYGTYFFAVGATAFAGAFLHHLAYKALLNSSTDNISFIGFEMTRETLDRWIDSSWRIVMAFSFLSHCALFIISVKNEEEDERSTSSYSVVISTVGALCYTLLGLYAVIMKNTVFILIGFLPALLFLMYNFVLSSAMYGIIALCLSLTGGIVQSLGVSPSHRHFNHNALSHVILSGSAFFMLLSLL